MAIRGLSVKGSSSDKTSHKVMELAKKKGHPDHSHVEPEEMSISTREKTLDECLTIETVP